MQRPVGSRVGLPAWLAPAWRRPMATVAPRAPTHGGEFSREEKKVIFASSLGTVFEWYDFYLYAVLAPFFAALFFPPGNQTAALLSAFAAYAAGFLVRPFGALVFGRIGDLVGRKYTFLVTIIFLRSAASTAAPRPTSRSTRPTTGAATTRAGSRPPRRWACSSRCW